MSPSNGVATIYYDHRVGYAQHTQLLPSDINGCVDADGKHISLFFCPFLLLNTVLSSFGAFLLEEGQTKPSDCPFCTEWGLESRTEWC